MRSICGVEGVGAAGLKEGKYGLCLIKASGTAAGTFTKNIVSAAPVHLMKETLKGGRLDGIIINSGCANAYTGDRGIADAKKMAEIGARVLGTTPEKVGVASTGVIGRYLDLDLIEEQTTRLAPELAHTPEAETAAARAIMTTDTLEKHALVSTGSFSVGGIVKGAGMIAPNMGTMLAFIFTDAELTPDELKAALLPAVKRSFNRVVVDGDTSTNDSVFLTATGKKGRVDMKAFEEALLSVCTSLAVQVASDGEGATKLLEVQVTGAPSEDEAEMVAKTIVGSPLVKTALYGEDPNWGRIAAAAGRAGVVFEPEAVSLFIGDGKDSIQLVRDGMIVADLDAAKKLMHGSKVCFSLDLDAGEGEATAWGCDLTEEYVEINGMYTT